MLSFLLMHEYSKRRIDKKVMPRTLLIVRITTSVMVASRHLLLLPCKRDRGD